MALPVVAVARLARPGNLATVASGFSLARDLVSSGIIGWPEMRFALTEIVPRLMQRVERSHSRALDEMVSLAKSRVPVDTGKLLNGITGQREGDYFVMRATAVRDEGSADYARFVEFGTKAGQRGRRTASQSRVGFYANPVTGFESGPGEPAPRARRQYRNHPGTQAQPYFYNSAREVMEKHFMAVEKLPAEIGSQLGL